MNEFRIVHLVGGPSDGQKIETKNVDQIIFPVAPKFKSPPEYDGDYIKFKTITYANIDRRCIADHHIAIYENDPRFNIATFIAWHLGQIPIKFCLDIPTLPLTELMFKR